MVLDELLDVPLVARLRPATLVVAAGRLVELVRKLLEPPAAKPVEIAALAADERDEHAVAAPDQRNERRQVERAADLHEVGNALAERQRLPDVVEPGAEEGVPVRAVAAEVRLEEPTQPDDVVPDALPLLVRQLGAVRDLRAVDLVEQGVDAAVDDVGRRRDARVEVEVHADGAAVLGAEGREVPKPLPRHRRGHAYLPLPERRDFT